MNAVLSVNTRACKAQNAVNECTAVAEEEHNALVCAFLHLQEKRPLLLYYVVA